MTTPIGDVNGDGWDNFISAADGYGFNAGIAIVLGGGPNIPRDPSLGVEQTAIAGRGDAISTWPNPVRDELHIAWRGDLKQMPASFIIYDLIGREVASGTVAPSQSEALWQCAAIAPGIYLLGIYDDAGNLLATHRLLKQ